MITCLLALLWMVCGIRFVPVIFNRPSGFESLALGSTVGIVLGTWVSFIFFLFLGNDIPLRLTLIILSLVILFVVCCKLPCPVISACFRRESKGSGSPTKDFGDDMGMGRMGRDREGSSAIYALRSLGIFLWVLFWWRVAHETVFVTPQGIFTGIETNFGDLGLNAAFTQYFSWGKPDLHNPVYSGILYHHHFLSNFFASLFVRDGFDINILFRGLTFSLGLLITSLFGIFVKRVAKSEICGWMGPLIFFVPGSILGVFEPQSMGGSIQWHNFLVIMLMSQRAFLLGLPALCVALILFWEGWEEDRPKTWIWAGILTGLMPMLSIFCFAGAAVVGGSLSLMKGRRSLFRFLLPLFILALPQILFFKSGTAPHYMHGIPGWMESAKAGLFPFLGFWLRNAGVFFLLLILALSGLKRPQLIFFLPFAFPFVIGNFLQLTSDMPSNFSFMYFIVIGAAPWILLFLKRLFEKSCLGRLLSVILFFALIAGGIAQLNYALGNSPGPYLLISTGDYQFSQALRQKTEPGELILAYPGVNHAVYWSGRETVMGYAGWIWGHAWGNPNVRGEMMKSIYEGLPGAEKAIRDLKIDVIVVGPQERANYRIREDFLNRMASKVLDSGPYQVYRIKMTPA